MLERQEIHCHACQRYVQFSLDVTLNGNHVLNCPNCGHEHCRRVDNGRITGERWDQRNGPAYQVTGNITFSTVSTFANTTSSSIFLYASWSNTATTNY